MGLFSRPIAHRGLHDRAAGVVENSAAAFEAAAARDFGIECDLQLAGDGEAVVFHDSDLRRLLGREGEIRGVDADALAAMPLLGAADGRGPQAFGSLLAQIGGRVPVVVELKKQQGEADDRALAARAAGVAASYRGVLAFKSFSPEMLRHVREAGHAGPLGIVVHDGRGPGEDAGRRFVLRHLLHYPRSRFTFVSASREALELPAVALFRSLGMNVMSWTVRDKQQAQAVANKAHQIVFEGFDPDS